MTAGCEGLECNNKRSEACCVQDQACDCARRESASGKLAGWKGRGEWLGSVGQSRKLTSQLYYTPEPIWDVLPQRGEHHPSIGNSARLPSSFRGASQHLQLLIGERMPRASSRGIPVVLPRLLLAEPAVATKCVPATELAELGRETVSAIDAEEDGLLKNSRKSSSPHCAQKKPSPHPGDLHAQDPSGSCEDGGISVHTGPD